MHLRKKCLNGCIFKIVLFSFFNKTSPLIKTRGFRDKGVLKIWDLDEMSPRHTITPTTYPGTFLRCLLQTVDIFSKSPWIEDTAETQGHTQDAQGTPNYTKDSCVPQVISMKKSIFQKRIKNKNWIFIPQTLTLMIYAPHSNPKKSLKNLKISN